MTHMRLEFALFAALAVAPVTSFGENDGDADDAFGYLYGQVIHRDLRDLPSSWFMVGGAALGSSELEDGLRLTFTRYVRPWKNVVFNGTEICLKNRDTYMTFRTADDPEGQLSWKRLQVTLTKPMNFDCAEAGADWDARLRLGLGLNLGQRRLDVAKHFALLDMADVATIRYEEKVGEVSFIKDVHVEFADGKLVRLNLSDYRE